jgi:Predicted acetyltransferase involved in intracellular survival and related acetyltransferases
MDGVHIPEERHRPQIAEVLSTALNFPIERVRLRSKDFVLEETRVVTEDDRVVATAAELRFHQWFGGKPLACSGIWGVATLPEHRSQGWATVCIESLARKAHDRGDVVTALFPAVLPAYRKMGYELAGTFVEHRVSLDTIRPPRGQLPQVALADADRDVDGVRAAYREWIRPHTGPVEPVDETYWRGRVFQRLGDDTARAVVVREGGRVTGFAVFSREADPGLFDIAFGLSCHMLFATTGSAWEALFGYFRGFRGVGRWVRWSGPHIDPGALAHTDMHIDRPTRLDWMLRLLDVPGAFEGRGYPPVNAVATVAVAGLWFAENAGPWRIELRGGMAKVARADSGSRPVPIGALSAIFTGYLRPHDAVRLGFLDAGDPAVEGLAMMLAGPDPWCPLFF